VHLGVILPNYGERSSPDAICGTAELAEQLGYDSVWATEHVIVGAEAAATYGKVYEPFVTMSWIAAGRFWVTRPGSPATIVAST
jgi:alkanesulfonate monooxygenase SsuD/methylene tetrahydromethanopterin reductase-like flavin-dependent oxidoreductase (luciferase family)